MEWKGVSSQISPYFSTWKLSSLTLNHMAKSSICIFRQHRMHKFFKLLPHRVWHLITIRERKEIYGVSRQSNIPYINISNHFAKCGQKGELSAVVGPIYYLKHNIQEMVTYMAEMQFGWEHMEILMIIMDTRLSHGLMAHQLHHVTVCLLPIKAITAGPDQF